MALCAPLVHAHPDDRATEHHAGRTVHTHWAVHAQSHHSSDAPALEDDDHDRAVFLNAFVAVSGSTLPALGLAQGVFDLRIPAERRAHRAVEVVHGHDPPSLRSLSSRAPPTCLV
jgi:hypothetical protein